MATIKLYSDLQQSKKLKEILPPETADAFYAPDAGVIIPESYITILNGEKNIPAYKGAVPCWSLVALLSVLPRVDIEKEICSDDTYDYRVKAYIGDGYIGNWHNDPIDACVEMIERLHKSNLL